MKLKLIYYKCTTELCMNSNQDENDTERFLLAFPLCCTFLQDNCLHIFLLLFFTSTVVRFSILSVYNWIDYETNLTKVIPMFGIVWRRAEMICFVTFLFDGTMGIKCLIHRDELENQAIHKTRL